MNESKECLIVDLANGQLEGLSDKIIEYKEEYPYDTDTALIEGSYYTLISEFNKAEEIFLESLKVYPYDVDVYFMLANVYVNLEEWLKVMEYATKAQMYASYFTDECLFYNNEDCGELINLSTQKINELFQNNTNLDKMLEYKAAIIRLNSAFDESFDIFEDMVRNDKTYVGKYFYYNNEPDRFAGYYNTTDSFYYENVDNKSIINIKTEFLKVAADGDNYVCKTDCPTLVPILSKESENLLLFEDKSHGKFNVYTPQVNHFDYCRVSEDTVIKSSKPVIIGEPVKLKMDESKKKLVISLFVDGLSQLLLSEEGLENVMPNTHKFFSKGLICENFFTNADWTYPSLATYSTGLSIMGHKMFNPKVNQKLPQDTTTLIEHMKKGGYYTSMISGDWRACGTDGYFRGVDRAVVKHQWYSMRTEQAICDAIEHIETFKETNQYVWLATGDLHDIADEIGLTSSVSAYIDVYDRKYTEMSATSVKQKYSEQKRLAYIKAAKAIDRWLGILYNYLETEYDDDEYVVTIFGDHGQTYLTKPEQHHLSRSHSNVAFMVRGGDYNGISKEYMSAIDYTSIMCKLAGLPLPEDNIEGSLPKTFGGEVENSYTLTETIHPGDPYMASIHSKDYTFYLTTENKVSKNFKLVWGEYKTKLCDSNGREIADEAIVAECTNIAFDHIARLFQY